MPKDFKKMQTGQTGEYLACAELGRRGYVCTPFAGNMPEFDLLISDQNLKTLPIQVKTSSTGKWTTDIRKWIEIDIDDTQKIQIDNGDKDIDNPNLIYICIFLRNNAKIPNTTDRFFILTKSQLQTICANGYRKGMAARNWKRSKNYKSTHSMYTVDEIKEFEDNWDLIEQSLNSLGFNLTK